MYQIRVLIIKRKKLQVQCLVDQTLGAMLQYSQTKYKKQHIKLLMDLSVKPEEETGTFCEIYTRMMQIS